VCDGDGDVEVDGKHAENVDKNVARRADARAWALSQIPSVARGGLASTVSDVTMVRGLFWFSGADCASSVLGGRTGDMATGTAMADATLAYSGEGVSCSSTPRGCIPRQREVFRCLAWRHGDGPVICPSSAIISMQYTFLESSAVDAALPESRFSSKPAFLDCTVNGDTVLASSLQSVCSTDEIGFDEDDGADGE
jgi:hypothetical protein